MTYTHLTSNELAMIEAYDNNHQSVAKTTVLLNRSRQTIHKVYQFFKTGHNALDYFNHIRCPTLNNPLFNIFFLFI